MLEELRHRKLLHHSSLFLMVTAETSREMVMGAREYHPDAYLTKPINRAMLEKRLGALAERREALLPVTRAMDLEDNPEAIQQCLSLLSQYPRHRSWIYKTLAELYVQVGDYGQARKIYDDILSQRSLSWARLGKARVLLAEGHLDEAIVALQRLVEITRTTWKPTTCCQKASNAMVSPARPRKSCRGPQNCRPTPCCANGTLRNWRPRTTTSTQPPTPGDAPLTWAPGPFTITRTITWPLAGLSRT